MGRGGTYTIGGSDEAATGFSLYIDGLIDALDKSDKREALFLPLGYDADVAARLRGDGWRVVAALSEADDGTALGCSHILEGDIARPY